MTRRNPLTPEGNAVAIAITMLIGFGFWWCGR